MCLAVAGHSSKEVAGTRDSNGSVTHARAKSSTAQDPESLVVLSQWCGQQG